MMRFFQFLGAAFLACATIPVSEAFAETAQTAPVVVRVDGKDPEDGSHLTGVRVASEDSKAFLFLMCDSDNTNPRIVFGHGKVLNKHTKPIGFDISIDGRPVERHYFAVLRNQKSAVFFVRTAEMYEDRFGKSPNVFNESSRAVNPAYIAWTDNIYNKLTADLFFGKVAALRFTDGEGEKFTYVFRLVQLAEHITQLKACYEAPRVY
ncbi:hypothetical protein HH303_13705 [Rhodospirillaceae bacterium KN72]|uniref:Secreted protein n=1 Tax=Pacificispira spongiicola TaxID=2729598 RepID=A0A7Y0HF85_9PROT|nr:hypothetical protein [Pacificispira spongiicola]NMM45545.1 hypothetical protein [Pacificispira spongiicola]